MPFLLHHSIHLMLRQVCTQWPLLSLFPCSVCFKVFSSFITCRVWAKLDIPSVNNTHTTQCDYQCEDMPLKGLDHILVLNTGPKGKWLKTHKHVTYKYVQRLYFLWRFARNSKFPHLTINTWLDVSVQFLIFINSSLKPPVTSLKQQLCTHASWIALHPLANILIYMKYCCC